MNWHRRVGSRSPVKMVKKGKTLSPASRIKGRIHLHNKQLPRFVQIDSNDMDRIYARQEMLVTLSIPLVSHTRKYN